MFYRWLADFVVALHVGYVACVLFGLVFILAGRLLGWRWIHNRWLRGVHLAMIVLVVARSLIWSECPLTTWEADFRDLGGQVDFEGSPVGAFLHALIHPDLPVWVFPVIYAAFAGLVVATLWLVPVNWRPGHHHQAGPSPGGAARL